MASVPVYTEDISTAAGGTVLVGNPCVVSAMTLVCETSGVAVISFSDDSAGYTSAHRVFKVVLSGATTQQITFPKDLPITRGLCATSNKASVDIALIVD